MSNPGKIKIIGSGNNSLEVELLENSDFSVTLINTEGKRITADFPNPMNGGGDEEAYKKIKNIYDSLTI